MSRGFVEVMIFQKMVLERIPEKDQPLVKEIFHLQAEIGTTGAYPFLHGTGSGILFWIIFFSKHAETSSYLTIALTIALCITVPTWILHKFYYGQKYRRLKDNFESRIQNDSEFSRAFELIQTVGKEIEAETK